MTKLSESLLRGVEEALSYAKKEKIGSRRYKVSIPKKVDVKSIKNKISFKQSN